MKNKLKYLWSLLLLCMLSSCSWFLDLDNYQEIPAKNAYETVQDVQNGLNGAYYSLGNNYFYGRNVVALGDMASDIGVASSSTGHFISLNTYAFSDTEQDLDYIWTGGYRVLDRTTRTIQGAKEVLALAHLNPPDSARLHSYIAQCYGVRALSAYMLVNIFGLPYQPGQVNNQPGIVVLGDAPIPPFTQVDRSSVELVYSRIVQDIAAAKAASVTVDSIISNFEVGDIEVNQFYMNEAAIYALDARVALAMGEYDLAILSAQRAVTLRASGEISNEQYLKMWSSLAISEEDIYTIAKTADDNLSANSLNTLYNAYKGSVSNGLVGAFDSTDIRKALINENHPKKFDGIPTSGSVNNIPVFRKSEMYLIQAEAYAQKDMLPQARAALLYTAKRNTKVTLDSLQTTLTSKTSLLQFIAQEREREFFQEGHRWFDARRIGEKINVANGLYRQFDVAKFVYPIPADEINSGFGVEQNSGWGNNLPK